MPRLTSTDAREIREWCAQGASRADVARGYGVGVRAIGNILTGRNHPEAGGPLVSYVSPAAKHVMTAVEVERVRISVAAGVPLGHLADAHGVAKATISKIARGDSRITLPGIRVRRDDDAVLALAHQATRKLAVQDVIEIRGRLRAGHTKTKIASDYGVSFMAIHKLARGETWRWVIDKTSVPPVHTSKKGLTMSKATKRGPGRPSLGKAGRTNAVIVKMSDVEVAAIKKQVEKENREAKRDNPSERPATVSSWIRDRVLNCDQPSADKDEK